MDAQKTAVNANESVAVRARKAKAKARKAEAKARVQRDFGGRRLVKTLEAAAFLDVEERTLECWRQRGGGPRYIRLAPNGALAVRAIRYRVADLEAFIADREVSSTADRGRGGGDAHPAG